MEKSNYLESVEMNLGIEVIPCESSNLQGYGYDNRNNTLLIAFKSNKVYVYDEVPIELFNGLLNSDSKGKYFVNNIRPQFKFTKYEFFH